MSLLDPLREQIGKISDRTRLLPVFRWGNVTSIEPLAVTLDADEAPTVGLSKLVAVMPGDRVLVLLWNRRAIILGTAGGPPSGTVTVSVTEGRWVTRGSTQHMAEVIASALPTPPSGYVLSVSMCDTSGRWAFVGVKSASAKILTIMDVANSKPTTTQTYTIAWQLVRSPGSTPRMSATSFETNEIDTLVETHETALN
ncbi:hypothetical protein FYJ24_06815 [Actinomycetaceae bacterium WB03_NA08]|uniref:Uncharacterized protein n=1 Tax=Scrofimicrobium canadense TaxID=2652290 RepID=A0A6N7W8L6_9ACTO|nr:hypothetical protein [Scrofimicrobium canadense]MSS84478.1 hypothetical protein [Scrofimicrobium canadense]